MQPQYSLTQTLEAINTNLNGADRPFQYRVEANQVIGEWKYLDAQWVGFFAAGNEQKEFKTVVTLDEATHTYTQRDIASQSESKISFNPMDGKLSFGKTASGSMGSMITKEFGFGIGAEKQEQNQTSLGGPTYKYSFNSSQLKQPLADYLQQLGWQPAKQGLLKRIFG